MPMYECACPDPACVAYAKRDEFFAKSIQDRSINPPCPFCKGTRVRLISHVNTPFLGEFSNRYKTPGSEGDFGPHFAYRRRNYEIVEKVYIDSFEKQRQFCKDEGLYNPTELPATAEISRDGRKLSSNGMPGHWI